MKAKVTMNKTWDKVKKAQFIKSGLLEIVTDIHTRAIALAPVDTSALRNSGVILPSEGGYIIRFGSSRVPYAKRRHFENKKNPQTIGYLEKPAEQIMRGSLSKYFRLEP